MKREGGSGPHLQAKRLKHDCIFLKRIIMDPSAALAMLDAKRHGGDKDKAGLLQLYNMKFGLSETVTDAGFLEFFALVKSNPAPATPADAAVAPPPLVPEDVSPDGLAERFLAAAGTSDLEKDGMALPDCRGALDLWIATVRTKDR